MSKQFANRDVSNLVIYDYATGAPYAFIDYANVTSTDMTGEVVYAYGGQGHPKKVSFSGDRGGTLRIESQMGDGLFYSMLTGAEAESTAKFIKFENVTSTQQNKFSIPDDYTEGVMTVYPADHDLDPDYAYNGTFSVAAASSGSRVVTFTPASGADSIPSSAALVVWYHTEISDVIKLNLKSTTFPKAVKICAETWDKDEDDGIIEQHMVVYKATPQPAFTISNQNTGDPGTITITYDVMEDSDGNMLDLLFVAEA